jgi:hypothetical protein
MDAWLEHAINEYDRTNHRDGDLLSHDWLAYALQLEKPRHLDEVQEKQWQAMTRVDALRDYLLVERQVALQNVRGQGYRIVPPSEQARYAAEQAMAQVAKGLQKGSRILTHTRIAELSDEQRRQHTDTEVKLSGIGQMIKRQKRDVFALFSPSK